jgi:hypothetical protein
MDTDTTDPVEAALNSLDAPSSGNEPSGDLLADFTRDILGDAPEPEATPAPDGGETPKPDGDAPEPDETPKTEDKPAEDPDAIPDKPKNKDDWNRLRESRDKHKTAAEERERLLAEREARLKEVEAEREELKAKAARIAELELRAKEAEEYEKELAVTRIEATREYKESIAKPLQTIGEQAEILAKSNETNEDSVFNMLNEADPVKQREAFKALTTGWDEVDRAELWSMAKDARVLLDKQAAMRENAHAARKEQESLAAQREAEQKELRNKEIRAAADTAIKALREKVPFVPIAEGETEDDRYNALTQKLKDVDFDSQTPRGKAFAAATALMYPTMLKMMAAKDAELAELRAAVGKKQATKPNVEPSRETQAPQEEDFFAAFGMKDPGNALASLTQSRPLDVRG